MASEGEADVVQLSALALMYASTGDSRFKERADLMVAELGRIQDAQAKRFHPGYLSAFPEEFFDRVESRQKVWAPYYTIHKIMAGLLDVAELCGNADARKIVTGMAEGLSCRGAGGTITPSQPLAAKQNHRPGGHGGRLWARSCEPPFPASQDRYAGLSGPAAKDVGSLTRGRGRTSPSA